MKKKQMSLFGYSREYPGVTPVLRRELTKILEVRVGPARLKKARDFIKKCA